MAAIFGQLNRTDTIAVSRDIALKSAARKTNRSKRPRIAGETISTTSPKDAEAPQQPPYPEKGHRNGHREHNMRQTVRYEVNAEG